MGQKKDGGRSVRMGRRMREGEDSRREKRVNEESVRRESRIMLEASNREDDERIQREKKKKR